MAASHCDACRLRLSPIFLLRHSLLRKGKRKYTIVDHTPVGLQSRKRFFRTPVIIRGVAYRNRANRAMWRNRSGEAMQIESHLRE